jgi:hypothetical protein
VSRRRSDRASVRRRARPRWRARRHRHARTYSGIETADSGDEAALRQSKDRQERAIAGAVDRRGYAGSSMPIRQRRHDALAFELAPSVRCSGSKGCLVTRRCDEPGPAAARLDTWTRWAPADRAGLGDRSRPRHVDVDVVAFPHLRPRSPPGGRRRRRRRRHRPAPKPRAARARSAHPRVAPKPSADARWRKPPARDRAGAP